MKHRAGRGTRALLFLAASGCGPAAGTPVATAPRPQASATEASAQADSVRRSYTHADVEFMTHMIHHHAQAIAMARLVPSHGASRPIRILSERIINAQQDEIATMQQWLRDRNLPVPDPDPAALTLHPNGGEQGMLMPGMLTGDQMRQLDAAQGAEFDRLFLTFMIQHHRGALTMVRQLFGSAGAAQDDTIFKFASDVNVDQETEVARMRRMLATMPAETRGSR
jgi:uncharacterized protein (DUF305 family)